MNMNEEYKMCFSTKKQSKKNLSLKKVWAQLTCQPPHHPAFWVVVSIATGFSDRCLDTPSPHPEGKQPVKGLPWPSDQVPGSGGLGHLPPSVGNGNVMGLVLGDALELT